MFRKITFNIILNLIFLIPLSAQSVSVLNSGNKISLRGLSVVDDKIVWVSGSSGTIGRSTDGGKTWKWHTVKGFEKNDFRDIEAFSESTAIIMAVGEPAYILKTTDGGESWKTVYENKTKGMFLDAMEFSDKQNGFVVGDPVNGIFFISKTTDGGNSWQDLDPKYCPVADSGEACFASSGTNIRMIDKSVFCFVSGGTHSNLITGFRKIKIPLIQGTESTGANSIAVKNWDSYIVVGGDFTKKDSSTNNCALTNDGGETWTYPARAPHGYRSCVEYIEKDTWICCGLNGVDVSTDNGKTWKLISSNSFHACRKAKNGKAVFLSGNDGNIGVLVY
ncbi:MAG: WD40/YVTN/BNR-like repeat-containing protein [Bacteroidia bacterium]